MDKLSLENIATNVAAYTVGGVPLITYVFLAVSAVLVGTMFQEEQEEEQVEEKVDVVEVEDPLKVEDEVEEIPYYKEEKSGGSSATRKTKRKGKKKPKRKRKLSKRSSLT